MLVVDRTTVRRLLPIDDAIGLMREAFVDFGRGLFEQPQRLNLPAPEAGTFLVKPASRSGSCPLLGAKLLSVFEQNPGRGREAVQGMVALFDAATGAPVAIVEAAALTELRTAAVSAVATDLLADPAADVLAVVGAGAQARAHVEAIAAVRPLTEVRVWNRTARRAEELASAVRERHPSLRVTSYPGIDETCAGADVICTTTAASEPLLWLRQLAPATHINAIGAFRPGDRELAADLVAAAWTVVDSRPAALEEAGDLLLAAGEGAIELPGHVRAELAELLSGAIAPPPKGTLTLFKSLGLAFQDLVAAAHVVERARLEGTGTEVELG